MNVRYRINRWALIGLWSAILCSTLIYATALRAQSGPTLTIVAPATGTSVDRPVTIRVEHTGIRFDGIQVGGNNQPGVGHWHVYVDDQFAGLSPTNVIELPNDAYPTITAGRHRITATLSENNHAPLNPPVSQTIELNFSQDVSIPVSQSGQPNLTVVFPAANASIDAPFVARIEHSGFRMDGLNSGKDPEPGTGHWHINVDGRYAGMSVSNVVELPNDSFPTITAGQHTLTFYVHQNNHVATNPPIAASIRINVTRDLTLGDTAATAGPTQTTAAGGGQTGATPTTAGGQTAATPTRASGQAGATPTTRATGTPGATNTATGTATTQGTSSPNTTASAGPSATIGLPGIPNTGAVAANISLPTSVAIMCLIIGSMLLYWSRMGGLETSPVPAGLGRQINLGLGSGFANALERMMHLTGARSSQRLAEMIQRLNAQPLVIRINISAQNLMRARTAMAFSGGAITGFSLSALFILFWTSQPTYMTQPVVQAPAEVAVAPITAPSTGQLSGPAAMALSWPADMPGGMALSLEDSWPMQALDAKRVGEPFLVFRDGTRSVIVRYADDTVAGATKPLAIAGTDGTIQTNVDGSFRATWQQSGRTLEMSGAGLSNDEIASIATSITAMSPAQLQDSLVRDAAHRFVNITLLWPDYMPAGVNLRTSESIVQFSPLGTIPNEDRYHLVFQGGATTVQVGGGTDPVPTVEGTTERFKAGSVQGQLTAGDRRFLLVLDTGNAEQATLSFAPFRDTEGHQLPMLQQGKFYIAAENIDRSQFDRIVAGLMTMRAPEFQAQARGQTLSSMSYMWPNKLPEGFTLDLASARYANTNTLLRGGHAYFAVDATGPDGASLTIKGGREADGSPFVVPEGQAVEQIMTEVHGRGATAVKTEQGNLVLWSVGTSTYELSSATVSLEQLLAVARGMTRVDASTWQRNSVVGPDTAPGVTRPLPLNDTNSTTVLSPALVPVSAAPMNTRLMREKVVARQEPKAVALPAPDRIVIPNLDLDEPVFSVDATVPKHNIGWYEHSGRPGQGTNIVMWGHVMRWKDTPDIAAPFADLHLLKPGATIFVVSATGERFEYEITEQIRVTPDKVSYLAPTTHEQLLLVSCIGDKIIVNGELTKAERLLTIAVPVE